MSGHAKKLSDLGIVIPNQLGIHRVLQTLPPSYKNFVMNYNMQNMNKELPELFSMLKSAEVEIKKENQVLMVNKTTSFKKQGKPNKGNFKKGGKKVAAPLKSLRLVMIVDDNDEDPAMYEEAMMSPDSNKWQEAMKSKMGSMYDNKVWTLVDLPDSRKAVENKWIFKRKTDADGIKLDLSQRVSDKFKELTTMRLSHL
ncbi:hypothetical protein QYE76_002411 [Lolium multiflorum]|uniref:Uncharacterized protein n=1 Tax=Lolium multiflorum TaxID=4521 RepID=A0AAD8W0L6_LOLMU|nr:hypothetical protein QYE76_002411 [Lolium multiflorum]